MAKIIAANLDKTIGLPKRYTNQTTAKAIREWFQKNRLLDESNYVETRNGLKIFFTGITEWHLPADVMQSHQKEIALRSVPYLPEVFESGMYKKIEPPYKDRSKKRADFILFHVFSKKIKIGKFVVTIRAKAGEYPNGKIIVLPKLTAYTFFIGKLRKTSATDLLENPKQSNQDGRGHMQIKSASFQSVATFYDSVFDDEDQVGFEIVSIERIKSLEENTADRFFQYYG